MSAPKPARDASPWTPFEDRRRARDEKRDAVLRMAVRLFLEDGYHRTPLATIAERLNITKPALYNYFASKEEILYALYRLGDEQYEESFGRIERDGGNGLHKLREMIRAYARIMTTDFGMCFARLDDRELGDEPARRGSPLQAPLRPGVSKADRTRRRGRVNEAVQRQIGRVRDRGRPERDRGLVQAARRPFSRRPSRMNSRCG